MYQCKRFSGDSDCTICLCGKCCLNCAKASGDAGKCDTITILKPGVCAYRIYALEQNIKSEVKKHGEGVLASYDRLM